MSESPEQPKDEVAALREENERLRSELSRLHAGVRFSTMAAGTGLTGTLAGTLAVGDVAQAILYLMDFSTRLADPQTLLRSAEQALGAKLDGFELRHFDPRSRTWEGGGLK